MHTAVVTVQTWPVQASDAPVDTSLTPHLPPAGRSFPGFLLWQPKSFRTVWLFFQLQKEWVWQALVPFMLHEGWVSQANKDLWSSPQANKQNHSIWLHKSRDFFYLRCLRCCKPLIRRKCIRLLKDLISGWVVLRRRVKRGVAWPPTRRTERLCAEECRFHNTPGFFFRGDWGPLWSIWWPFVKQSHSQTGGMGAFVSMHPTPSNVSQLPITWG